MSNNWVVENIQNAIDTWNDKFAEIWRLLSQSPEEFKDGAIWNVIFAILACASAVGIYFGCRSFMGTETLSWVCMLGAAPFAALGFIKYNGMTAEKIAKAWIRSEILMPRNVNLQSLY